MASCQRKSFWLYSPPKEYSEQSLSVCMYQDANKMLNENTFKISVSVFYDPVDTTYSCALTYTECLFCIS